MPLAARTAKGATCRDCGARATTKVVHADEADDALLCLACCEARRRADIVGRLSAEPAG